MSRTDYRIPDYLFETGWEVCNKVGGIYTVISTKAYTLTERLSDHYITIGPDLGCDNKAQNIEFEEDPALFAQWRMRAYQDGLRIRVGRWKSIEGRPIVILVDFTGYISKKDDILKRLWEDYKVDSISGQWDYIEPVLFGYAAARVIENFTAFNCRPEDKVVAHFHEWMTCSGVLYLHRNYPSIATVFTTHATVLGRSIASNGLHLYSDMSSFNPDEMSHRFGVRAKHSIEAAAAGNCDCFTTVSAITSEECEHLLGKAADVITPNGFEENMVWDAATLAVKRREARELLIRIAETALDKKFDGEPFIVGTSGRYEFKNKGLDEYIDSLAALNRDDTLKREILAYILVPGWNLGPRKDLQEYLAGGGFHADSYAVRNVTHYMGDVGNDAIINHLRASGLLGDTGKVSVMFVPAYLNGADGVFNKHYYDLLPGFDMTVFPSYYEPWGYTPLESIAFGVPSITTSLAGFGRWVMDHSENHEGVSVIERSDFDDGSVRQDIADDLRRYVALPAEEMERVRAAATELSHTALWKNLIVNYYKAYDKAMNESDRNIEQTVMDGGEIHEQATYLKQQGVLQSGPSWTRVLIERDLPERLRPLDELSHNLWWSWTRDARDLFESIDPKLWLELERNPIALLDNLTLDRLHELENDASFLERMDAVYALFCDYMAQKKNATGPRIAYFSMEYGLHSSLKIYSGGLGILAGDYLKEASDKNIPMVAVGLLYRYGYFTQKISSGGEQEASYEPQNFFKLPISPVRGGGGEWVSVRLDYPGREVTARLWRCDVGRTELYLLDTDDNVNLHEDRTITYHLYGGDWENRLKQEILLGMGGIKALGEMGITADVYHCNEGHAAFIGIRRALDLIETKGLSFSEALEVVRSSSLFTTHTPVPAGHDSFPEDMIRQYMNRMPEQLKITWEQFINLGKINPNDPNERFSMSFLACNMSQEVNGVSWLHGEVSKDILGGLWPGYFKPELHIGYVTNGVHFPTWTATNMQKIYQRVMGDALASHYYDQSIWRGIYNVPDKELWDARMVLKEKLVAHIKRRVKNPSLYRFESPTQMVKILERLDAKTLTIGFARRFATYKRAYLLFTNLERLSAIVNNPERPVQFIFAGKAHPNDKPGQDLIKRIVEVSAMPQFVGKIIFLQNYDMEVARRMVQGVDVWMNTPTRPLEASGTSGEKAVMNGVLHFSVLDGWWVEGYRKDAGWMLPMERTFEDQRRQDELDAESIYTIIEEEIAPAYYNKDEKGVSSQWMGYVKNSIAEVASNFTTKRMIEDYQDRFYDKLDKRSRELTENNYSEARQIAAWKRRVSRHWDTLRIVEAKTYDVSKEAIVTGEHYKSEAVIDLGELTVDDIGVEMIVARTIVDNSPVDLIEVLPLTYIRSADNKAHYGTELSPRQTGSFDVAIRVYARNPKLPNRMDFALVKWS